MLFLRNDVEATILRLPGQLYERKGETMISNVYTYKLVNKTTDTIKNVRFELRSHKGTIKLVSGASFIVPAQDLAEGTLFIEIDQGALKDDKVRLKIEVFSDDKLIETTTTSFLGPRSYR